MVQKVYTINTRGPISVILNVFGYIHSSINISLTYLRGLELPELTEEDMPMV